MDALGYKSLSADELIALRHQGVMEWTAATREMSPGPAGERHG
jgi:hypothetical protein